MYETTTNHSRYCALCNELLTTKNDTDEHIIPNAIGGRRTVRGFICEDCNNLTGAKWDDAVAKQFSVFSLLTGIKRQRGDVPAITFESRSGKKILLEPSGVLQHADKPKITEEFHPDRATANIQAASTANEQVDRIAEGLCKKFLKRGFSSVQLSKKAISDPVFENVQFNLSFGDNDSGKSYVKTALALASKIGINIDQCECAKDYLIHGKEPCFGYYYTEDAITERPELVHIVAIEGKPEENLLLAYVEYFSFFRIVVCLSKNYTGGKLKELYALDPREGGSLNLDVNLPLTLSDIDKLYDNGFHNNDKLIVCFEKVIERGLSRIDELQLRYQINTAYTQTLEEMKIDEDEVLSEDRYRQFSSLFTSKLMPYFEAKIKSRRYLTEAESSELKN